MVELIGQPKSGKTHQLLLMARQLVTEGEVLLVDVDGRADLRQLQGLAEEELSRIHVFRPLTIQSLIATLSLLPRFGGISGLLVDGLNTYHRVDRKQTQREGRSSRQGTAWFQMQRLVADTLREVHQRLGCLTVVTLVVPDREFRDPMIPRWRSLVNQSYWVERDRPLSPLELK